jgi:acyl transferase domain-containing protein
VHFASAPVEGEVGLVLAPGLAGYPDCGRDLFLAVPRLLDEVSRAWPGLHQLLPNDGVELADRSGRSIYAATSLLTRAHVHWLLQVVGLRPDAVVGLSLGELEGLHAFGVLDCWSVLDGLLRGESSTISSTSRGTVEAFFSAHGLPVDDPSAEFQISYLHHPVAAVSAACAAEPLAVVTTIMSPADCLIAGQKQACDRIIERLRPKLSRNYDLELQIHSPELAPIAEKVRRLVPSRVAPVPHVRFYSGASKRAYRILHDARPVADAVAGLLTHPADWPALVEQAYRDGVRVFVEAGPRGLLTSATRTILGDRPHMAIALDAVNGSLHALVDATLALWCAGVRIDLDAARGSWDHFVEAPDPPTSAVSRGDRDERTAS